MTDIPAEIIEQAAQAALDAGRAHLGMRPALLVDQVPQSAECWRVEARAAVEAAAPLIAAQAWDEALIAASEAGFLPDYIRGDLGSPYREADQ